MGLTLLCLQNYSFFIIYSLWGTVVVRTTHRRWNRWMSVVLCDISFKRITMIMKMSSTTCLVYLVISFIVVVRLCHADQSSLTDGSLSSVCPPKLGLPTLNLGIPGRPALPSHPIPSPPLPPSRYPWAPPLNQLEGLGERRKLPQWVWGEAPADKRFGAYIWAKRSSSSGNSFCAFS